MTPDQISSKHKKNLFIATVICLIAILVTLAVLNFSFGFVVFYLDQEQSVWWNVHSPVFLLWVTGIMLSSVAYEIYIFREGGHSLAEQMNARRLILSECAPEELMALELTQKLADQFQVSTPAVYVLPNEIGVNVLTAGVNDYDTVIILTWGALQNLDKLELYGLLSYAFNQIITGETRQNIRLKILFSALITFNQLGSEIARRGFNTNKDSTQNKFETILVAVGGIIWLMGSLGLLVSRCIKYITLSGRTFKNDIQTKLLIGNDTSLQTLLRIYVHHAGSQIHSSHSEAIAHMCFANSLSPQSWLNTHPDIEQRIYKLDSQALKELKITPVSRLMRPTVLRFLKPHRHVNVKLSHRWQAPKPLPVIRFTQIRFVDEDHIRPLSAMARRVDQPKVIRRAMQTGTGTKEVLVAILTLRQHRALIPKSALVSHAIIDALMAIDHRLHIQIFFDACDLLPKMPKSMAYNFLTRLASVIQADGKVGLLDILLLEKVKFQLQILPKHMPTASEVIYNEKIQFIDALLHVQNLTRYIDMKKRSQLIQQLCPWVQHDQDQEISKTPVDLGEILHQLSGLLLRDRLKFLDIAEQCLWNDRVITQEELDVLELLYWRLGIENDMMKDQVLKRNSMLII